jgi:hypothetical protein
MPDYVFEPTEGTESRLTLSPRAVPWHVRVGGHDLFIEIDCGGRWVHVPVLEETVGGSASPSATPPLPGDEPIVIAPERVVPDVY